MRRTAPVLLSAVLSTVAAVGTVPSAAVAAPVTAGPGTVATTWLTGTVAPGASVDAAWKNVRTDAAYGVSLSPTGADLLKPCRFQVTRSWNEQRPTGNRDFHFTVENVGSIACGTKVFVTRLPAGTVDRTGTIAPGATRRFQAANLDVSNIYRPGLLPSGATGSTPCKLEVTQQDLLRDIAAGVTPVVHLDYAVTNVGSTPCQADILLGATPIQDTRSTGVLSPGSQATTVVDDTTAGRAYAFGVVPHIGCRLSVTGVVDVQRRNLDGSTGRQARVTVHNPGAESCGGQVTSANF